MGGPLDARGDYVRMIMKMHVAELWRYPVKSLAGEKLQTVELSADGIPGDRVVQVYDREGRIVTARTAPRLLGLNAVLGPMGEPLVNGRQWRASEVTAAIEAAARPVVTLMTSQRGLVTQFLPKEWPIIDV